MQLNLVTTDTKGITKLFIMIGVFFISSGPSESSVTVRCLYHEAVHKEGFDCILSMYQFSNFGSLLCIFI